MSTPRRVRAEYAAAGDTKEKDCRALARRVLTVCPVSTFFRNRFQIGPCLPQYIPHTSTSYQVFSWGNGCNGRLGLGDQQDRALPCFVDKIQGVMVKAVFCGVSHSMAVSSAGRPYVWGKNSGGQCEQRDRTPLDTVRAAQKI